MRERGEGGALEETTTAVGKDAAHHPFILAKKGGATGT